eukprot:s4742_g8.t1
MREPTSLRFVFSSLLLIVSILGTTSYTCGVLHSRLKSCAALSCSAILPVDRLSSNGANGGGSVAFGVAHAPIPTSMADRIAEGKGNHGSGSPETKGAEINADTINKVGDLSRLLAFQPQYKAQLRARPDVAQGELVRVTDWKLLTPDNYDRTCFHIEVDVKGTGLEHLVNGSMGKALSVYALNPADKVTEFLTKMKLDPDELVSVEEIAPQSEDGTVVVTTVYKLFTQYLDLFGKPSREFLKKLFPFAQDIMEKVAIAELTLERKTEDFLDRQARAYTYADYILEFPSLKIPVEKYAELLPTIKQRVYSICSSSDFRPGKCQLLVVREDWQAKGGDTKFGLCSSFMTFLRPGAICIAHATHSVMQIPEDKSAPIFMAGLGTGLAPFRAYIEQRKHEKSQGARVGPMTLFFGGRHKKAEFYYQDEMEAYEKEGLVKCCNAWSRDQKEKVYVQHKIMEEAANIWQHLGREGSNGYFFLCGCIPAVTAHGMIEHKIVGGRFCRSRKDHGDEGRSHERASPQENGEPTACWPVCHGSLLICRCRAPVRIGIASNRLTKVWSDAACGEHGLQTLEWAMGAASSTESTADTTKKRSKGKSSKKKAAAELQDGKGRSERLEEPDAEDLQPVLPEHVPELSQTLGPAGLEWPEGCPEPRAKVLPSRPESEGLEAQETLPLPDIHFETTPSLEGEAYDNFQLEGYDNFPNFSETRERESFGVFGFLPAKKDLQSSSSYRIPARRQRNSNVHSSQALRVRLLRVSVPQQSTGLPGDLADLYVKLRLGAQNFRTPCIENDQMVVDGNDFTFQFVYDSLQLEVMRVSAFRDELLCKVAVALGRHNLVAGEWRRQRLPIPEKHGEVEFELLLGTAVQVPEHAAERKKTAEAAEEELEYQGPFPRMFQPKAHALPWEGVRVLELTRRTWTAALCGQMMAASGAEVIRVAFGEEALLARKKGNAPRKPLRSKDTDSLEKAKANLVPRQLHVGKRLAPLHPEDPEEMALLRSDLLTGCNVFLTDLPADELEDMQLSTQTLRSRFPHLVYIHTSCIGMLADVAKKGVNDAGAFFCLSGMAEQLGHFLGPAGFAAAVSASALFGVACMAVMRRRCGSPGDRVEMSIFRAGRWCAALGALTGWHKPQQPDLRFFMEPDTKKMLATPFDVEGVAHVRPAIRSSQPDTHIRWTVKDPASLMPGVMPGCPVASELPLARVSVIEISDEYQVSASAVGALLADLGARVTKLERPQRPDPWKRTCPQLYKDLTARKSVSVVNYSGVGGVDARGDPVPGQAALYRTLAQATILVTNLPLAALAAWGLEPKHMREMFPHLIILWITTWGCDETARQKELTFGRKGGQEAHAFWEASGLCQAFNGNAMPPGLSELAVAQHALGGLGMALLRQQRTGAGQLVHISRYQAGLYCQSISSIEPVALLASPLLQTLDGRFLRLLGRGHQPHDAWVLLHALGRRESLIKRAGNMDTLRKELQGYTWEDLQKHQDELLACARNWSFQDLVKAFQEKGIDWIVEEMRPMDAEALHRPSEGQQNAADVS